ncbi:hypothetical protein PHYBOEH_008736 [Phytophthora boehmeriae]|uniref:Sec20 C-terminal domain-containing protein n=1 Tax=Phytophthora boehmeriae TaxID=109152 RepID=A0A8T1X1N7_9STRA|nr:hypothetical protein PHYBOEH_008736 [Phytophthora boehmeriae]
MESVERAEQELSGIWRYVSTNLALRGDEGAKQQLRFSVEEEQTLEEKISEGIDRFKRALTEARGESQEIGDPKEADQTLQKHQEQLNSLTVGCRKVLVTYRQRAKVERLEQARKSLLPHTPKDRKDGKTSTNAGSAVDVTAALKRTRQVMSQEIERVSSVTKVLDDGRLSLRSSREEFGSVNAEIAEVRKRLKALEWQAKQDKLWIGAGITVLLSTVLFIVYERTGLIFL